MRAKAVKGAVQHISDEIEEIAERVSKLELANNKKAIVITGLYLNEDKEIGRRKIDQFLYKTLNIRQKIEDYYEIGSAQPRAKVVLLHSLRDKLRILRSKSMLKGLQNDDGKQYYINEYYAPEVNEKRRFERQLIKENAELEDNNPSKVEITYENGQLQVDGQKFMPKIVPPSPQKLLDISTEKLKEILNIPICKGPQIEKEGNVFIGFNTT